MYYFPDLLATERPSKLLMVTSCRVGSKLVVGVNVSFKLGEKVRLICLKRAVLVLLWEFV
mgnify:CR=1 FL=1